LNFSLKFDEGFNTFGTNLELAGSDQPLLVLLIQTRENQVQAAPGSGDPRLDEPQAMVPERLSDRSYPDSPLRYWTAQFLAGPTSSFLFFHESQERSRTLAGIGNAHAPFCASAQKAGQANLVANLWIIQTVYVYCFIWHWLEVTL